MKLKGLIVILIATLLAGQAMAGPSLVPHKAEYKVRISLVSGRLKVVVHEFEVGAVEVHGTRFGFFRVIDIGADAHVDRAIVRRRGELDV